jgi:hypothetical protein
MGQIEKRIFSSDTLELTIGHNKRFILYLLINIDAAAIFFVQPEKTSVRI